MNCRTPASPAGKPLRKRARQRGATSFEITVVVSLVGIMGFAGYRAFGGNDPPPEAANGCLGGLCTNPPSSAN
jgi:hypothetical protein